MHSEDLRLVLVRQLVDVTTDLDDFLMGDHVVDAALRELVIRNGHDVVVLKDVEDAQEQVSVEVIRHVASIIDLTSHVFERLPRDLIVLNQEILQHCN